MIGPMHEDDPRMLAWTRAYRRHAEQERRTARAIQLAEQAAYFAQCPTACSDAKARAILARAAMKEEQRRLIFRRRDLEHAERTIAPVLRTYYQKETNP